jgi:hypothetical protein
MHDDDGQSCCNRACLCVCSNYLVLQVQFESVQRRLPRRRRLLQLTRTITDCVCVCVCVCARARACACVCVNLNKIIDSMWTMFRNKRKRNAEIIFSQLLKKSCIQYQSINQSQNVNCSSDAGLHATVLKNVQNSMLRKNVHVQRINQCSNRRKKNAHAQ